MVLSRIILAAFLAFGSIAVALPVVPGGGVTGTTPTPGSGARRLPRMQGDDLKPKMEDLEAGMNRLSISPLAGGPSSPHGVPSKEYKQQEMEDLETGMKGLSISPLGGPSSPHGVPPPGSSSEVPSKKFNQQQFDEELRQKIALIKNFPNVHNNYKEIADRLSKILDKKDTPLYAFGMRALDTNDVLTLAKVIENYMKPQPGEGNQSSRLFHLPNVDEILLFPGKNSKIEKLRKAFKQGDYPQNLRAILYGSSEPGIH
ncbi:hypothetical protein GG344DRAFT_81493 [Lentinula edodes]|nr:hypothetical protein GG344DRAFT_81493 [Lentinula edodes]